MVGKKNVINTDLTLIFIDEIQIKLMMMIWNFHFSKNSSFHLTNNNLSIQLINQHSFTEDFEKGFFLFVVVGSLQTSKKI